MIDLLFLNFLYKYIDLKLTLTCIIIMEGENVCHIQLKK